MDIWLLGILLGYEDLPERAGDLWDAMQELRYNIAWEETHKNRDPITSVLCLKLSPLELEFRNILIEAENKKIKIRKGWV